MAPTSIAMKQQSMQTAQAASAQYLLFSACTLHLRGWRWHVHFADTTKACEDDPVLADCLQALDLQTSRKINEWRRRFGMPETIWPHEADRWINESDVSYRQLAYLTAGVRCYATYGRCLRVEQLQLFDEAELPEPVEASYEISEEDEEDDVKPRRKKRSRKSLIQLGYVKFRDIARPGGYKAVKEPKTVVWIDEIGPFIEVNMNGDYRGDDGEIHDAFAEGYTEISRQFLYDYDVVNEAIAGLAFLDPPEPLPRHGEPLTVRRKSQSHRLARKSTNLGASTAPQNVSLQTSANSEDRGGTPTSSAECREDASKNQNIIFPTRMSTDEQIVPESIDFHAFRHAPWTAATIKGLSAANLKIPDPSTCDPDFYEQQWGDQQWERLRMATQGYAPERAWEFIDAVEQYMETQGSPSWWQRPKGHPEGWRKTKVPVTAKNVADYLWDQWEDYQRSGWHVPRRTPYDGEPWPAEDNVAATDYGGYAAGYAAVDPSATEPVVETAASAGVDVGSDPLPDQAPPPGSSEMSRQPMSRVEAVALSEFIAAEYPGIPQEFKDLPEGGVALRLHCGPRKWDRVTLKCLDDWNAPSTWTLGLLQRAIAYGEARASPGNEESDAPPGREESIEGLVIEGQAAT